MTEKKIEVLLSELTLKEKIRMVHGDGLFRTGAVERLGIPSLKFSDGPIGVRQEFENDYWIPLGNSDDYVTYNPCSSAVAATWNRKLAYEAGKTLGEEARGRGKDIILAPGINIKRVPVCGRNFEYMSEDPYLTGQVAVPMIRGIQETDVAACVKHFALNNQETERLWVNVEIEERALREIYLPAFEAAVKEGKVLSLMGAYNLFRGVHCCENKMLLEDILRKEWGFDGMVVSDWGAVHHTEAAGEVPVDVEMSVTDNYDDYYMANPLLAAIQEGRVTEDALDKKVKNILRLMLRLKMIDIRTEGNKKDCSLSEEKADANQAGTVMAVNRTDRAPGCYNTKNHQQTALEIARESIVLLKNEEERLPLKPEKLRKLLVIGDNAERLHASGGGSAEIKALYEISPLMGIKTQLGGNCQVTFARGYYVAPKDVSIEVNWQKTSIDEEKAEDNRMESREKNDQATVAKQKELRDEAVRLASQADEVILIGGLNHDYDVEGADRVDMSLPYAQDELICAVLEARPDAVIVIKAGSPVSMERWMDSAKAIVWDWYSGMEGGNALAEVLFGKVNPSGKLPESIPCRLSDIRTVSLEEYPGVLLTEKEKEKMSAHLTECYQEGIFVGYRYYEKYGIPTQFCFGHGLSYTTFAYHNLSVKREQTPKKKEQSVWVFLEVENTGNVEGKETVQIYVGKENPGVNEPVKQLGGFEKISLKPGEKEIIRILLQPLVFSCWDTEKNGFSVVPGKYRISVGSSLKDIRLSCQLEI